jgi:hypothetical protein
VAHWLTVLPFAEAWLEVGSAEPRPDGFVLKVWWFLHPVMNADSVQPCVFPDALRACHSWVHCCSAVWALTDEAGDRKSDDENRGCDRFAHVPTLPCLNPQRISATAIYDYLRCGPPRNGHSCPRPARMAVLLFGAEVTAAMNHLSVSRSDDPERDKQIVDLVIGGSALTTCPR